VLKLSSDVSDVFPEVLKLSFEVSECKALIHGLPGDYEMDAALLRWSPVPGMVGLGGMCLSFCLDALCLLPQIQPFMLRM
jgi:hypothetical protein